ncbi:MAG: hypothetical protein WDO74_17810 [Pseudomonadota bacterium]
MAFEASNAAAVGAGSRDRIERLVRTAEGLSLRSQDPHGSALAKIAGGLVHVFSGEWRAAQRMLDEAEVILRERCRAVTWELTNAQAWSCNALILCGDLPEATARVPALIREARERSDRYALMHMIYPACISALAANDVDTGWARGHGRCLVSLLRARPLHGRSLGSFDLEAVGASLSG